MDQLFHDNLLYFPPTTTWKLLKYNKDGFFNWHTDKKLHQNHTHTALIFPADINNFTGGKLIIADDKNIKNAVHVTTINVSVYTKWVLVFFPIEYYHSVQKITNGVRYVFKTDLFSGVMEMEPGSLYRSEGLCD